MQALILTAGKGERMQPLSFQKQKHLIKILGKTILEHNLELLDGLIDEAILVISPNDQCKEIKDLFGKKYKRIKIKYAIQKEALGTGDAVKSSMSLLEDKFLLLNGDDLYSKQDIQEVLKTFPCLLAKKVKQPQFFGVIEERDGIVKSFIEKPSKPKSNLANTGLYFLPKEILNYSIKKSSRGEYEFTDYIRQFIKEEELNIVEASQWIPISYSWNLLEANKILLSEVKKSKRGKSEEDCHISGKIIIGKGTVIKGGTYIEGPVWIGKDCVVGPNAFLRKFTSIGDNCRIGQAVEIKNSLIGKNTNIAHFSYVGDSIIGENCNLGAGTITANLRRDGETIKTEVKDKLIDTKERKFGTVLGDGVQTGIGTLIYPGRKIWPNKSTLPGEKVKKDIK
ncbi:MAG: bifunctional sugar-1-phosphate nucleotidylyltransferase/acetyltransferase [Patescibacteria group bacterium]|nr:bifunctional sugar-1-phosphate nucleotidylyltransferase/acetyltransferase [Patescibacteria group bacterium]